MKFKCESKGCRSKDIEGDSAMSAAREYMKSTLTFWDKVEDNEAVVSCKTRSTSYVIAIKMKMVYRD